MTQHSNQRKPRMQDSPDAAIKGGHPVRKAEPSGPSEVAEPTGPSMEELIEDEIAEDELANEENDS